MAKFTVDFPADLEKQIDQLEIACRGECISKMLEAGGEVMKEKMQQQCRNHRQSGNMIASIKTTKAEKNDRGYFVVTRPTGTEVRVMKNGRIHKVRNMEKLAYLHYGTSKQRATGIITKVINQSRSPAVKVMQEVFNREVQLDG